MSSMEVLIPKFWLDEHFTDLELRKGRYEEALNSGEVPIQFVEEYHGYLAWLTPRISLLKTEALLMSKPIY